MQADFDLAFATGILVAIVAGIQLTILIFRNKARPHWLRSRLADTTAALVISTAFAMGLGNEFAAMIATGMSPLVAIVVVPLVYAAATYAFWRLFNCRERLRRADAGQSPFRLHGVAEAAISKGALGA